MSDTNVNQNLEVALKNELTVVHNGDEFVFKIPSVKDRLDISAYAAKLRKEADPEGGGIGLGYDPNIVFYTETLATFLVLLKGSSAKWVYTPGLAGKPAMDISRWPDNVPVAEVVDQFNKDLEKFRADGN